MKNGKIRIWLGVLLIIAQLVSLSVLDNSGMKLWDTSAGNTEQSSATAEDGLDTIIFGLYVGYHKLEKAIFEELPEEMGLIEDDDKYTMVTSEDPIYGFEVETQELVYSYSYIEEVSRDIRHNLYVDGYQDFLDIYDFFVVIGFLLCGILGLILLISGFSAKGKWDRTFAPEYYTDALVGFPGAYLRVPGLLLCLLCALITVATSTSFSSLLGIFPFLLMAVFFIGPYGKRSSVLPAGALVSWGLFYLLRIWEATVNLFLYSDTFDSSMEAYYALLVIVGAVCAALYFIAGVKLYRQGNKDDIKNITLWSGAIAVIYILFGPLIRDIVDGDLFLEAIHWDELLFTVLLVFYVWFVFAEIPIYEVLEEPERPCPSCGAPLSPGKTHCSRCGTPVAAAPAPAQ